MKKIFVQEFITLDGFIEDPKDQQMTWVTSNINEEMVSAMAQSAAGIDTLLIGRTTYEILSSYWPTDMAKQTDPVMHKYMNNSAKIVFSKTLTQANWHNTTIFHELDVEQIQKLKLGAGTNIAVVGSASIAQALMNLDMVDQYQLMVYPLTIGNGKPLFKDQIKRVNLELIESKIFTNGVMALTYKPRKD
jgi:dihydrofolate reductase